MTRPTEAALALAREALDPWDVTVSAFTTVSGKDPRVWSASLTEDLARAIDKAVAAERAKFVEPLRTLVHMGQDYRQEWVCEFIRNNGELGWLLEEAARGGAGGGER